MSNWNLKQQMINAIKEKNGFVNCHAHFDKAYYIKKDTLDKSMLDMEMKWHMSDEIKRNSTKEDVKTRIRTALDKMISQNCNLTASFIDAYETVDHKNIDAAREIKVEYKNKIKFLTITQPLGGLINQKARDLYEAITSKADIAGGLPSYDRPNDNKNYDILFSIAKNLDKPLHVHIDQENNPEEKDTEKLINYTIKHGYQGRVVAIHAISISAQPKKYRQEIYKKMADAGISIVVCPSAAIAMRQLDQYLAPVHNSIANISEMIEAGIKIGLGIDNIYDFYQPFIDGDMWVELRILQEACRYYNFDELVNIATINGREILKIK